MLYRKREEAALSERLFKSPTAEYRGTPFWAWNGRLDPAVLTEQIEIFRRMGLGGFHMHVRTGLQDPYLDDAFMDAVRVCVEEAKAKDMLAYLYDEDRWPSGAAGGKVTDAWENGSRGPHRRYARQTLMLTMTPYKAALPQAGSAPGRGQVSMRHENGDLLAVYEIILNEEGRLASYRRIDETAGTADAAGAAGRLWYAYREYATDDPWFNNHPYVDTMNPEAIRAFLESTHEAYAREFSNEFGKTIPSIFTDEPQVAPKRCLDFAAETKDVFLPWTEGMDDLFRARFGDSLLDSLPELIWERADGIRPKVRWQFQNLVTDRFVESFCDQVGAWCEAHGIQLTGHVMGEPTLESQTQAVGDAMRCYRAFGIPGIDMLCDHHEFTTAKQTQSMVRQYGKEGMLSELYGVTGWDYDLRGYKLQGDWQAALGVTLRVPHLAWESMHGEAKRDYPASISYQSPWWPKYHLVEDHFARLNTALTRGKAVCRVAVVHPIESYWLLWGPTDQVGAERAQMETQFAALPETLLKNGIDFDYLDEARLEELCGESRLEDRCGESRGETKPTLRVGKMEYETVVIPPVITLRASTVRILAEFAARGGRIVVQGEQPEYIDAERLAEEGGPAQAEKPQTIRKQLTELYRLAEPVGVDPERLLKALEDCRTLEVRKADGTRYEGLVHMLRRDGDSYWLFIANAQNPVSPDIDNAPLLRFTLQGSWKLTEYKTLTGEIRPLAAERSEAATQFVRRWHSHDSLLLKLEKAAGAAVGGAEHVSAAVTDVPLSAPETRFGTVEVSLAEPNMLLLDEAEWSLNGGEWQAEEEILRLDNKARDMLGIVRRLKEVAQPYTIAPVETKDRIRLRFSFESEIPAVGTHLALEDASAGRIFVNGAEVTANPDGWYVDHAIETVPLPELSAGENTIEVEWPIGPNTDLEACYLLGDFGVRVQGTEKVLTAPVKRVGFGDIVPQGLPFYTGNLDYRFMIETDGSDFTVRVPAYRGGLVTVLLDGEEKGDIVFSPYLLRLAAEKGVHELTLRLYGTRMNGFGQLHLKPGEWIYQSPNSWRTAGDRWGYEYYFKEAGILKSPEIFGARVLQKNGKTRPADAAAGISDQS